MNKIQRSWKLMKAAFAVLFREKKLLLFPLVASALALVVLLFFIAPVVLYPTGHPIFSVEHWSALGDRVSHWFNFGSPGQKTVHSPTNALASGAGGSVVLVVGHPWTALALAILYFVSMFLATFSNVAFYHEIMQALNGNAVSIRRGYRFACERWRAVLMWSLFAGLVGYLIQTIQQRVGLFGRVVTGLIGFVWSVACIFIIPTLVRDKETSNPLKLLRNSMGTLRGTWGEVIIGFVGLELVFGSILFAAFLFVVLGSLAFGFIFGEHFYSSAIWIGAALTGVVVLLVIPLSWISSIVNPVYRCALYIYATEGVVPGNFDKELLDSAWKVKSQD